MSYERNDGQTHNIKIGNKSFKRMEEFRYLGPAPTNQNLIHEEIKSRLKSGNACYHWVQNLLSFSFLSKNLKIRIHRILILRVVFYECEAWSLILRVFENRVLRKIFGPKGDEVTGDWKDYITSGFVICTPHQILCG
jgi:hypothetical protein